MDARDQTISVTLSKVLRIDTPLHSASKLTAGQTSGSKPKSPKIVGDNVSYKVNPSSIVESNIQGSSVAPDNKDRETDSEVAKSQTGIADVNVNIESRMEGQTKPAKKLKTAGISLSKKKSNKDEKEDKSKLETGKLTMNKQKRSRKPRK